LYDRYCAKRGKTKSTGNRSRGDYQSSGSVGASNVYLEAGSDKPEALLRGIDKGFYVNLALGLHAGVDSTSGDFSFPVAGFLIEKGEITTPARGISMAGNIFEFLKSVDKIADDLTWFGAVGCPTFLVKSIAIGRV
jgi:PmbA protein